MRKQKVGLLAIGCIFCLLCGCTVDAQNEGAVSRIPMPETSETSTETETKLSTETETEVKKITEEQLVKEVPDLTVVCGGQSINALHGTSYWHYVEGDSGVGTNSCSMHPLDAQEHMPILDMTEGIATLEFTYVPDTWSACCWSDENWGNTDAESEPAVKTEGGTGIALESGYIYEIHAQWDSVKSCGGDGYYSFYVQ